jgi:transposase InsO family protein
MKHGVTKTAITYKTNRQYVYRWLKRYNGEIRSLANASTRPKSHPNAHTLEEIKLIKDMYKHNKETGLVRFWIKLKLRGYDRSVTSLYRVMIRLGIIQKEQKKKKRKPKPYIQMTFPGERIQVDVKFVPLRCISGNMKLYQYTAIDEFSRVRYLQMYEEKSTYTSYKFIKEMIKYFPFKIYTVRTDNGPEFTKRLISKDPNDKTMMEYYLKKMGIAHDLIKPYTPTHNGKVERSHRKDNEQFYSHRRFYSLEDARRQLRIYNNEYNKFPMKPLNWRTPNELLNDYLSKAQLI